MSISFESTSKKCLTNCKCKTLTNLIDIEDIKSCGNYKKSHHSSNKHYLNIQYCNSKDIDNDYNTTISRPKPIMYDIIIIGAGAVGCSIARELAKYKLNVVVLEKSSDVAAGASKANSGIIHGGYDAKHGTLKAKLVVEGNKMWDQLNKELNFGFKRIGSLVLAFNDEERHILEKLIENGNKNGENSTRIVERDEVRRIEPFVSPEVVCALYCGSAGITSPYEYCIALIENAIDNGVKIQTHSTVVDVQRYIDEKHESFFQVVISESYMPVQARYVINASGLGAAHVAMMVGANNFTMEPRKGEYLVLAKSETKKAKHVLFQCPSERGKGILVSPTFHGNLLIGPTSRTPEEVARTPHDKVLEEIVSTAHKSVPSVNAGMTITSFSGLRPKAKSLNSATYPGDFIVEVSKKVPKWINCAGVDSPGLTSSPAIALYVCELLKKEGLLLEKKSNFKSTRAALSQSDYRDEKSFPGRVGHPDASLDLVCQCELVTREEIERVINYSGLPATTVEAVKRRTRAGAGTCQGTRCEPRVKNLIAKCLNTREDMVTIRDVPPSSILSTRRLTGEQRIVLSKL